MEHFALINTGPGFCNIANVADFNVSPTFTNYECTVFMITQYDLSDWFNLETHINQSKPILTHFFVVNCSMHVRGLLIKKIVFMRSLKNCISRRLHIWYVYQSGAIALCCHKSTRHAIKYAYNDTSFHRWLLSDDLIVSTCPGYNLATS